MLYYPPSIAPAVFPFQDPAKYLIHISSLKFVLNYKKRHTATVQYASFLKKGTKKHTSRIKENVTCVFVINQFLHIDKLTGKFFRTGYIQIFNC